ncbi:uncharacterized protein LOC112574790 isoform X2 [Pomacea canaliculata]|uniref:uncharacterized protein LOC112574790 isoform X2 n=1 Tax=Pomacea canaliculata TaxID=400727 RepID=UPI000D72E6E0|nr:uncharacterized protein LOC112574790 isoform X2 [Pomacea canaliculata]
MDMKFSKDYGAVEMCLQKGIRQMLHMLRTRGCHINRRRVGAVVMLAVGFSLTFVVFSKSTFQDGKFQDWKEGVVPRKRRLLQ